MKRLKKVGLKLNIQKTKAMSTGPMTSWEIEGKWIDYILGVSKVTADGGCNYEIKEAYSLAGKLWTT